MTETTFMSQFGHQLPARLDSVELTANHKFSVTAEERREDAGGGLGLAVPSRADRQSQSACGADRFETRFDQRRTRFGAAQRLQKRASGLAVSGAHGDCSRIYRRELNCRG